MTGRYRTELSNYDKFMDAHPRLGRQIARNPSLAIDPNFIQQHPELCEYLQNHPRVREDLRQQPKAFLRRENQYERHEGRPSRPRR